MALAVASGDCHKECHKALTGYWIPRYFLDHLEAAGSPPHEEDCSDYLWWGTPPLLGA
jgi:hypothetical protein